MTASPQIRVLLALRSPMAGTLLLKALTGLNVAIDTTTADTSEELLEQLAATQPALVVLELKENANLLAGLRCSHKALPVIAVMTEPQPELAFIASRLGVEELLVLPLNDEEARSRMQAVLTRLGYDMVPVASTPTGSVAEPVFPALFGTNPRMAEIRDTIAKVATTSATVLIRGESGVGKEVVARMIYARSQRSNKPFVKVNCAAIPNDLLESELFGYEAGAFTGAVRSKPGKFELAHTGTLFLDEIGEMHPQLQAKLLQVLQDGEFSRLGAKRDMKVDVRVLCATNKLLEQRVSEGFFREDLFYRINVVTVHIPPLRERRDEIPVLIRFFLEKYSALYSRALEPFSMEAMRAMQQYSWPGNIRELENLCKRYVIVGGETQILRELAVRQLEAVRYFVSG
ncbi:MAG: sigma 54-interacting transcriptional regulator [Acidobacteriaceae bacterium]